MTRRPLRAVLALLAALACLYAGGRAVAGVSGQDLISAGLPADLAGYAGRVSASEGNWTSVNQFGCAGAFQFCPETLSRYYTGSRDAFLASPGAQVDAFVRYSKDQWALADRNGLTAAIGKTVCDEKGSCATITESSILMACQFGCGTGGKLDAYVKNGFNCSGPNNTRDGNGRSVCSYLVRGSGFDVASVSNGKPFQSGAISCLASLSGGPQSLASPFDPASGIGIAGGGGASVLAGQSGTATWQPGGAGASNSVVVAAQDGSYRSTYSGMSTLNGGLDTTPPTVTAGTPLGQLGPDGAPQFGVALAVRRDVLARAGAAGRTGADTGAAAGSLTAGALGSAVDGSYFSVNPETFLSGRIPVLPSAIGANPQAFAGRADTAMTLPTTCAVDPASIARSGPGSTGSGPSVAGGASGLAGYRTGSLDFAAVEAAADRRGLFLDLARIRADGLRLSARGAGAGDGLQSTLAHLLLLEGELRR